VASPPDKTEPAPERNEGVSTGSVASRLWDATRKLITITDHLSTLEREDARMQNQLSELSRLTLELVKDVREISGQLKGIEKRLDDKDKMVEAIIQVRIMEAMAAVQSDRPSKPRAKKT
jgi:chromosome segregation ATPase